LDTISCTWKITHSYHRYKKKKRKGKCQTGERNFKQACMTWIAINEPNSCLTDKIDNNLEG
jgi:hypothetical protein